MARMTAWILGVAAVNRPLLAWAQERRRDSGIPCGASGGRGASA